MLADQLKSRLNEDYIFDILISLGCKNIKKCRNKKTNYFSCSNPDGDNVNAINVYLDSYFTKNYTRPEFESKPVRDIISLVEFIEDISCFKAIQKICKICNFDYYSNEESNVGLLSWMKNIETGINKEEEILKPIANDILKQFCSKPIKKWYNEGVGTNSQKLFEIGFDIDSERITIPIRDEIGNLVGIKGRLLKDEKANHDKYLYLYTCPKDMILFGLHQNYKHIKKSNEVIVVEAEKSVIKLNSLGYKNAVATGNKHISETQINKLLRLGVPITIAFDKDVTLKELKQITKSFEVPIRTVDINIVYDEMDFLKDKECPMDNVDNWNLLYNNFKITA